MDIFVRKEEESDYMKIYNLVEDAFKKAEHSDLDEHNLVVRLRESENYIPELALIGELDDQIAAHIMLTKLYIVDGENRIESLALAPVAVSSRFQGKGVGTELIESAIKKSKKLGYKSIFVLGSEKYYPRFGFKEAKEFEIYPPFEVPSENFMAMELEEGSLKGITGTVEYTKEFFEK